MAFIQPQIDDVVFLNVLYEGGILANIHVSWLDPQKTRKMVVVGSKKMVIYDDVADDKIQIYDKGIDPKAVLGNEMHFDRPPMTFSHRSGDIHIPKIEWLEPLRTEASHFIDSITFQTEPLTGLAHARSVIEILERASNLENSSL